jgi:Ca2+-binding RTX toxin-like protein
MPDFTFEMITPEQATAFSGSDTFAFTSQFATFTNISVVQSGASLTFGFLGREVTLGAGFTSQVRQVPIVNGSTYVTGTAASETFNGASAQFEAFYAGAGNDTLIAGAGDRLAGGDGVDLFVIPHGVTGATIVDFKAGEKIAVAGVAPTLLDYIEETIFDIGTATNLATTRITSGAANFVLVKISDTAIAVFIDSLNENRIGARFTLEDVSLADVDHLTFIAAPAGLLPSTSPQDIQGTTGSDALVGGENTDTIQGLGGQDTINGGAGDDFIFALGAPGNTASGGTGQTYLRGDDGNDSVTGGAGFDDINGNMGNDTCVGGDGADYVLGGKDNDSLSGLGDADLVYGNLGNDTCDGGDGDDILRGGQDNDVVSGGRGADFVSGDKGSDTMSGGAGADIFHTFGDAGIDRVTDFSLAEGDRVQVGPGTQYVVSQVGVDTVIDMTGGGQMILVGVTMSSLTPGWIFGA